MTGFLKHITHLFRKPTVSLREQILQQVLAEIDSRRCQNEHCILIISDTGVVIPDSQYSAPIALIGHEKIGEFQETLLFIEERLIKDGHYCIVKLAEDKSYANMFIYIDESILV
jgi:hypothetical protein